MIWRPPSLSELTPMILDIGLTHLGSWVSIFNYLIINNQNFEDEINIILYLKWFIEVEIPFTKSNIYKI